MQRHPVQSSVLRSIGYDKSTKILELEFIEGGTYDYFNLSPRVFKRFIDSESPGHFFTKRIKGKYIELKIK
jgi:hypothetical protein